MIILRCFKQYKQKVSTTLSTLQQAIVEFHNIPVTCSFLFLSYVATAIFLCFEMYQFLWLMYRLLWLSEYKEIIKLPNQEAVYKIRNMLYSSYSTCHYFSGAIKFNIKKRILANFLHAHLNHLNNNMLCLMSYGGIIEKSLSSMSLLKLMVISLIRTSCYTYLISTFLYSKLFKCVRCDQLCLGLSGQICELDSYSNLNIYRNTIPLQSYIRWKFSLLINNISMEIYQYLQKIILTLVVYHVIIDYLSIYILGLHDKWQKICTNIKNDCKTRNEDCENDKNCEDYEAYKFYNNLQKTSKIIYICLQSTQYSHVVTKAGEVSIEKISCKSSMIYSFTANFHHIFGHIAGTFIDIIHTKYNLYL